MTVYFSSITHAMKIKKQLLRLGIEAKLIKYSNAGKSEGCGYGLAFAGDDYFTVVLVLKDSGLPYSFNKL